jgi:hypothetical protein
MFFNVQKPVSDGVQRKGELLLKQHLFRLLKSDPDKKPAEHSKALESLANFLTHHDAAPGQRNPFLTNASLDVVNQLIRQRKLPAYSELPTSTIPWQWPEGAASIVVAAKLTETKNEAVIQLQKAGEELARDPNADPAQFQEKYQTALTPFYELLAKFLPESEREKHKNTLEQDGAEILTEKVRRLRQTGDQNGASPEEKDQAQQDIKAKTQAMRRFTNSEEYIQHVLAQYENRLLTTKAIGKTLGDITIGTGVLFFAPSTVVPFIVAGYIGHRLSTMNVIAKKDRKEQRLRDQSANFQGNLDKLSRQEFGTIGQKLGAYLEKLNFLPRQTARKFIPLKTETAGPAVSKNGSAEPAPAPL